MPSFLNEVRKRAEIEASKLGLDLINVEWVNEYNTFILRITADTKEGLTIDESTALNEKMSEALDEMDLIKDEYMLEVSSPGIERELITVDDVRESINEYVHIEFFKSFEINKNKKVMDLEGTLLDFDGETLVVSYNNRGQIKKLEIMFSDVKLIRLAIKF